MKVDVIKVKISDDGLVLKTETDPISGANHASFERVLEGIQRELGGPTVTARKGLGHKHEEHHTTIKARS